MQRAPLLKKAVDIANWRYYFTMLCSLESLKLKPASPLPEYTAAEHSTCQVAETQSMFATSLLTSLNFSLLFSKWTRYKSTSSGCFLHFWRGASMISPMPSFTDSLRVKSALCWRVLKLQNQWFVQNWKTQQITWEEREQAFFMAVRKDALLWHREL